MFNVVVNSEYNILFFFKCVVNFKAWVLESRIQTSPPPAHSPPSWGIELMLSACGQVLYHWDLSPALLLFWFVVGFPTSVPNEPSLDVYLSFVYTLQFGGTSGHTELFSFGILPCFLKLRNQASCVKSDCSVCTTRFRQLLSSCYLFQTTQR